jgi:hypothetical protein
MTETKLPRGERILITSATGRANGEIEILKLLASLGEVVAPTRAQSDLSNPDFVHNTIGQCEPRLKDRKLADALTEVKISIKPPE